MMVKRDKDIAFGERMKELREHHKRVSQDEVADATGLSKGSIQRFEYGEVPTLKNINKLTEYFGCSKIWLIDGIGEPFPDSREKIAAMEGVQVYKGYTVIDEQAEDALFVYVPQLDGRISAGGGIVPEPAVKTQIAFRRDWIVKKGKPENMLLIKVSGDSMEPTLYEGDLVLIDKRRDFLDPQGGIYAIAIDDSIMIKRLQADPSGKVRIISDNKSLYPPMEADPDKVRINGKVIWFARELER
jgi:phage repressor protein C with HTH and peptisase S24 domain